MSAAHTYKTRSWKARVGEPLKVEADVASGRHCLRRGRGEQWWGAGTTKRWKQRGNIKTGKKCTKAREMGKPRTHMWGQWHQRKERETGGCPGALGQLTWHTVNRDQNQQLRLSSDHYRQAMAGLLTFSDHDRQAMAGLLASSDHHRQAIAGLLAFSIILTPPPSLFLASHTQIDSMSS